MLWGLLEGGWALYVDESGWWSKSLKDAANVNSSQRLYKHICATSESEAWREWQRKPKEQNGSPAHRGDERKASKRKETAAGGRNSYQLNSYGTSHLELPYTKNGTAACILKSTQYYVLSLSFMPFNVSAAIFVFWITSFFRLQILLVWEIICSTSLIWKLNFKTYCLRKNSL